MSQSHTVADHTQFLLNGLYKYNYFEHFVFTLSYMT